MPLPLKNETPIGAGGPFPGTVLLHKDTTPLDADETRTAGIDISHCSNFGGTLYADQACTLNLYYGQDGSNYGDAVTKNVGAGESIDFYANANFYRALKIEVVNGVDAMTAYRLHLRGRA